MIENAKASLARTSLDACVKCTICETQCPVARATPLFSGPKWVGPQAERFRAGASVDLSLDYCSGCSICTTVCPHGVKIAEINAQARAVMKADHMPLRDRLITQTSLEGRLLTPIAPIANAALANRPIRKVIEKVVGVHADAPMPTAQTQSFMGWWKKWEKAKSKASTGPSTTPDAPASPSTSRGPAPAGSRGPLVFFHGCAGGWFEVATSIATVEVLEYLGFEVIVPNQGCCGLAQQSNGLFDQATKAVLKLCDQLRSAGQDLTIVTSSGSCGGMLRHEAHEILGVADPRLIDVGSRIVETSEFLLELAERGEFPVADLAPIEATIPYHQPCQVKSQGYGKPAVALLELIPGLSVKESGQPCCGIAGTYGLKKEKFEVAQEVGRPLFEMVSATNPEIAACETETCRWQIAKGTGAKVVHPVQLLHRSLGLGD